MAGIDQANDIPRLDEEKIHELKDILGDEVRDIIDEFLRAVPNSFETIATSVIPRDAEKVFVEAHTLKSSSGNIGLARFCRLCAILEEQARNNQIIELEAQLKLLNDELSAGVDAINSMM